jgi:hypothetical protein
MLCTGCKTGAKGSHRPVLMPKFPLVNGDFTHVPTSSLLATHVLLRHVQISDANQPIARMPELKDSIAIIKLIINALFHVVVRIGCLLCEYRSFSPSIS